MLFRLFVFFSVPNLKSRVYHVRAYHSRSVLETLILSQYRDHKFHNLFSSSITSASFLSAASLSLFSRSHPNVPQLEGTLIGFESICNRIRSQHSFDIQSNCVKLLPSRQKGESLILPNLDLKVLIESARIALEIIYDKRFATFSYCGRPGLGRHTAVRYLKNSVKNPNWWFKVAFKKQAFGEKHLNKLVDVIGDKIVDAELVKFVDGLFRNEVVKIELGGISNAKGFVEESDLNKILINVYFDGLDRLIQEIREEVHKKNPRMDEAGVLHKPIRVYAVRYLDEILVVSSGGKLFTMNIRDKLIKYVERELELKVDNQKSSIHSAVVEKIDFMGFELQAVPPNVLRPPMSEKAMRAKKKYLKRKAAKSLELKNARETIRKKLGMKIWSHVFKKLRRCDGFKFDFTIETEVREIFRSWGDEVVQEFFKSKDARRDWHRILTSGDFFSLKRIRDQLPTELVDSYDDFQEKVNEYMMPVSSAKYIKEYDSEEEEEERIYAKRTVEDLTELRMKVNAPIELIRKAVKLAKITNAMGRPRPIKILLSLDDADIIKWYAGVGQRWLNFFCCCRNIKMIKTVVNYHLRFSCFLTLAEKHESTKRQAIQHYTKDLKVSDMNGVDEIYFPTEREIKMLGDRELVDPAPVDGALGFVLVRLAVDGPSHPCLAHFCSRTDTVLYRVRLLQNRLNVDPLKEKKWVPGMGFIHESLNKKCMSLCSKHSSELLLGRISFQDIDCTSFLNVE